MINYDNLIDETSDLVNRSGLTIGRPALKMIISTYNEIRRSHLEKLESYEEDRLGITEIHKKRLSKTFNPKNTYSAYIKLKANYDLKDIITLKVNKE